MNLNELAKAITTMEGKKKNVDIAQVKEILMCLSKILYDLATNNPDEVSAEVSAILHAMYKLGEKALKPVKKKKKK